MPSFARMPPHSPHATQHERCWQHPCPPVPADVDHSYPMGRRLVTPVAVVGGVVRGRVYKKTP